MIDRYWPVLYEQRDDAKHRLLINSKWLIIFTLFAKSFKILRSELLLGEFNYIPSETQRIAGVLLTIVFRWFHNKYSVVAFEPHPGGWGVEGMSYRPCFGHLLYRLA